MPRLTGMTVGTFEAEAKKWTDEAKDGRWKRPYTELTYQPMQEVLNYLRANGFKTYIVTGGGQDFVPGLFGARIRHSTGAGSRKRCRHDL